MIPAKIKISGNKKRVEPLIKKKVLKINFPAIPALSKKLKAKIMAARQKISPKIYFFISSGKEKPERKFNFENCFLIVFK